MDEDLLGYLLGNLDEARHSEVECRLRSDPQARERLDRLRQAVAPLEVDREAFPPPADMVVKTLAHVAEQLCRDLPRSPKSVQGPGSAARSFWRRADVLVAASLLLTAMALAYPAISHLRYNKAKLECQKNLSDFYTALAAYNDIRKELPNFAAKPAPQNVAGMIAPMLNDAGVLPSTVSICCPANSGPVPCTKSVAEISALTAVEFAKEAPHLIPCYAYALGYRDEQGYHCPSKTNYMCVSSRVPLMSDCPPQDVQSMANSPNHGGPGQNVLFDDGHVEFVVQRVVNNDDLFLNLDNKAAAGVGCRDNVLGASAAHP